MEKESFPYKDLPKYIIYNIRKLELTEMCNNKEMAK